MSRGNSRMPLLVLGGLIGLTLAVLGLLLLGRTRPVGAASLPHIGRVQGFQFTNQAGVIFDSRSLAGRVWVADLIFTRCPGPCVEMTRNLVALQKRPEAAGIEVVTLTADPEYDTPAVLQAYAERFGADTSRWRLLTGPKSELNRVALQQLLLAVADKEESQRESENDLFLHSTKWVLVDSRGNLRGVYEGTEPTSVDAVLRDARRLERE